MSDARREAMSTKRAESVKSKNTKAAAETLAAKRKLKRLAVRMLSQKKATHAKSPAYAIALDGMLLGSKSNRGHAYVAIHRAAPAELVAWVRQGVPAGAVRTIALDLGIDQERLIRSLGVGRSTIKRKAAKQQRLSPAESDRVIGVTQLVAEVQRMVDESGSPEGFHAAAWVGQWIRTPVPALGNSRPEEYLDTAIGQQQVLQILRQMQSGAYA